MSGWEMDTDTFVGSYCCGLTSEVITDDFGIKFEECDESSLRAIGAMSTVAYKLAAKGESTPRRRPSPLSGHHRRPSAMPTRRPRNHPRQTMAHRPKRVHRNPTISREMAEITDMMKHEQSGNGSPSRPPQAPADSITNLPAVTAPAIPPGRNQPTPPNGCSMSDDAERLSEIDAKLKRMAGRKELTSKQFAYRIGLMVQRADIVNPSWREAAAQYFEELGIKNVEL